MATTSRRSFLKAAGAAAGSLLLPSFYLAKPERFAQINLMDFVDEECDGVSTRYKMDRPFRQGATTYATDGRVCIRTALAVPDDADEECRLPPVHSLDWKPDGDWKPWPTQKLLPAKHRYATCPKCLATGRLGNATRCQACDGWGGDCYVGEVFHAHCPACDGAGWLGGVKCDYCLNGHCDVGVPALVAIGDLVIDPRYDAKLRRLEGLEWQPHLLERYTHKGRIEVDSVVRFRCNGGDGLLMPLVHEA